MPKEKRWRLYVGVPKLLGDLKPCLALVVLKSSTLTYLGRKFVDGRNPKRITIRGHLYYVPCADHCVAVMMAFLTRVFLPPELAIQYLFGHNARIRVEVCGAILFPLPQHVYNLVRGIKMQDYVEGTVIGPMFFLLNVRRLDELTWTIDG